MRANNFDILLFARDSETRKTIKHDGRQLDARIVEYVVIPICMINTDTLVTRATRIVASRPRVSYFHFLLGLS